MYEKQTNRHEKKKALNVNILQLTSAVGGCVTRPFLWINRDTISGEERAIANNTELTPLNSMFGSAPASKRIFTILSCPRPTALNSRGAERLGPLPTRVFGSHPIANSSTTSSVWKRSQAQESGEFPFSSWKCGSAPLRSSVATRSRSPGGI